jgi:energy-coupling factor transport system permease protein
LAARRPPSSRSLSLSLLRSGATGLSRARRSNSHHGSIQARPWSRHDIAFACSAVAILALAVFGQFDRVASFQAYPLIHMPVTAGTLALCAALIAAVLLPFADRRGIDP